MASTEHCRDACRADGADVFGIGCQQVCGRLVLGVVSETRHRITNLAAGLNRQRLEIFACDLVHLPGEGIALDLLDGVSQLVDRVVRARFAGMPAGIGERYPVVCIGFFSALDENINS